MKISNNKPFVASPLYKDTITKDYDPAAFIEQMIAAPMFRPLVAGTSVIVKDDNNQTLSKRQIAEKILYTISQDMIDVNSETALKQLFSDSLSYYDKNSILTVNDVFAVQAANTLTPKLPEPTSTIIYTPSTDVIPAAKEFLGGQCGYEKWFASMAFFTRANTLGVNFTNETVFNDFKQFLSKQMNNLSSILPADVVAMFGDFQNLNLSALTESLILRNGFDTNNEPCSFARTFIFLLMSYVRMQNDPAACSLMPFSLMQLIVPKTIVFINLELHSKATSREIKNEWDIIEQSIRQKPMMISNKKLSRLTAATRYAQKLSNTASASRGTGMPKQKSASIKFRNKRPNAIDVTRIIKKIISKMTFVNTSMNTFRTTNMTFARANRRDPDDFNKQGKSSTTRYIPDIHVYVDTSGSISERDYADAMTTIIRLAKKLNVDVYFNSFSDVMSQTHRLHTQGKTTAQVYNEFSKVAKVTGGTDYEQIWHFINASKKRSRELSILITDFEYAAPYYFVKHPKNLYYIPCSTVAWDDIRKNATLFATSMMHNDTNIRAHILF